MQNPAHGPLRYVPKKYIESVGGQLRQRRHAPGGPGADGAFARGADPNVDALYRQQARETDRRKREALLHQMQQLLYERVRFGPLWEFIWPSGIGPRVAEPALMLIDPYPWSAPLEEVRLKPR